MDSSSAANTGAPLSISDLVLFILKKSPPNMGVKKLNKLAFFLEFSYFFEFQEPLTDHDFAAIPMGPVINDYQKVLAQMCSEKKIYRNDEADPGMHDYLPLEKPKNISSELDAFLSQILEKYQRLSPKQLEDLSHALDSYNITIHENKGKMGAIIDKDLAMLDSSLSLEEIGDDE